MTGVRGDIEDSRQSFCRNLCSHAFHVKWQQVAMALPAESQKPAWVFLRDIQPDMRIAAQICKVATSKLDSLRKRNNS